MKNLLIFILCCFFGGSLFAQQHQLNNQFLMNRYIISPAYAGYSNNMEGFLGYRESWVGVPGAPKSMNINLNGPLVKNAGFGVSISNNTVGIFRNLSAKASYSYAIRFSELSSLTLGLSAGLVDTRLDLTNTRQQDQLDPIILKNTGYANTVPDASFGMLFRYKKLNLGVVSNQLIEGEVKNATDSLLYTLVRHVGVHLAYGMNMGTDWDLTPIALTNMTSNSDLFYEIALQLRYRKMAWLAPVYHADGTIGVNLGTVYNKRVSGNYTYETGSAGIAGAGTGTHEFNIGFLLGKLNPGSNSIFNGPEKRAAY